MCLQKRPELHFYLNNSLEVFLLLFFSLWFTFHIFTYSRESFLLCFFTWNLWAKILIFQKSFHSQPNLLRLPHVGENFIFLFFSLLSSNSEKIKRMFFSTAFVHKSAVASERFNQKPFAGLSFFFSLNFTRRSLKGKFINFRANWTFFSYFFSGEKYLGSYTFFVFSSAREKAWKCRKKAAPRSIDEKFASKYNI